VVSPRNVIGGLPTTMPYRCEYFSQVLVRHREVWHQELLGYSTKRNWYRSSVTKPTIRWFTSTVAGGAAGPNLTCRR
jgi:hypothetical protein